MRPTSSPYLLLGGCRMKAETASRRSTVKYRFLATTLTLVVVGGAVCLSPGMSNEIQKLPPACPIEFAQITSTRLDAGEQTFESLRVLRNGMVEWARWNSSGTLLDHAGPFDAGSETFDQIVSSPAFLKPPEPRRYTGILGRPAYKLEITTVTQSSIETVVLHKMPDDLAALTDRLKRRVPAAPVQPGWYMWTKPYPRQGPADIDLTETRVDSAAAMTLSDAVTTGKLIVQADDSVKAFVSGERSTRIAFVARLVIGDLHFGVLSAKR